HVIDNTPLPQLAGQFLGHNISSGHPYTFLVLIVQTIDRANPVARKSCGVKSENLLVYLLLYASEGADRVIRTATGSNRSSGPLLDCGEALHLSLAAESGSHTLANLERWRR